MSIDKLDILAGAAVLGVVATAGLAGHDALKAERIVREKKLGEASAVTKLKATAGCYIPTIVVASATVAAIVMSRKMSAAEIGALSVAAAGLASNKAALEREIESRFGKETLDEIKKKIDGEPWKQQTVEYTGNGQLLCIEGYSGRLFWSSEEAVKDAVAKLNERWHSGEYLSMNDFYTLLGIENTHFGWQYGWAPNEDFYDAMKDIDIQVETVWDKEKQCNVCCIDVFTYPMECYMEV